MLPRPTPNIFAAFEFSSKLFKLLRLPSVITEPDTEVGGEEDGDPGEPTNLKSTVTIVPKKVDY